MANAGSADTNLDYLRGDAESRAFASDAFGAFREMAADFKGIYSA